jgi:hypothetical protein
LENAGLLDGLAADKLKAEAQTIAADRWKWIKLAVDVPYGHAHRARTGRHASGRTFSAPDASRLSPISLARIEGVGSAARSQPAEEIVAEIARDARETLRRLGETVIRLSMALSARVRLGGPMRRIHGSFPGL